MLKVQNKEEETIHYAKKLHLINVKNNLATYIERAKRENLSHLDFLNYLLREEVEQRPVSRIQKVWKISKLNELEI